MILVGLGVVALAAWVGLAFGRAWFWVIDREPVPAPPALWPPLVVVVPARDEADGIAETLRSLWDQEYPGGMWIVVVDDHSADGTAAEATRVAAELGRSAELTVVAADPLPDGWAGKVWAMEQGLAHALAHDDDSRYVLFSDADISHGRGALRELVSRAEVGEHDLVSFMVRLECRTLPEKLLIPAFVHFFRMLYPFRRCNDPADRLAGAAGGTMLARRGTLERIGGLASIKGAVIDDCALAAAVKAAGGRLWVGMSEVSRSTRRYGRSSEIIHMVARSAYAQLRYSPAVLVGCLLGLAVLFAVPVGLVVSTQGAAPVGLGATAWLLMAALYLPMVRFYGLRPWWSLALPAAGLVYAWATMLSAWRRYRGRGDQWKGRRGGPTGRSKH